MDTKALVIVGRRNPELPSSSSFSPFASGVCVDPSGIIVTCCHVIEDFISTWGGPFSDLDRFWNKIGEPGYTLEEHEQPYVFFPTADLPWYFPTVKFRIDRDEDVAVGILAGDGKHRPLPFMALLDPVGKTSQKVRFMGHHQPPNTPSDKYGLPIGWTVSDIQSTIIAEEEKYFYIPHEVPNGMSGAPICAVGSNSVLGIIIESWSPDESRKRLGLDIAVTKAVKSIVLSKHLEAVKNTA